MSGADIIKPQTAIRSFASLLYLFRNIAIILKADEIIGVTAKHGWRLSGQVIERGK